MAVQWICGWEARHALADNNSADTGTCSYNTNASFVRTGTASLRVNPGSGASGYARAFKTGAFLHFAVYVATLPSVTRIIAGQSASASLRLNSDGTISAYDISTLIGTSSTALSTGQWYWIGWRLAFTASGVILQINGTNEVSGTNTGSTSLWVGCSGTEASAIDLYFDDGIADDTGFLAASKVNLLVPISDNARAALWTGGIGGTTNLYDAVNNTPPVGTATETDTTQIEHAGGAAGTTDAYDANMTTYTTAGINSGDTVLGIQYVLASGEDVSTGVKLLNFSLVSNPTQATGLANFDVYAAGGALGTYPTNWTTQANTMVIAPSVTLGTSPVMRVVRPETASRVASVCFMGMHVAWTPAAAGTDTPAPYVGGGYYP